MSDDESAVEKEGREGVWVDVGGDRKVRASYSKWAREPPRGLEQESNVTRSVIYLDHSRCCAGAKQKRDKKRSSETGEGTLQ